MKNLLIVLSFMVSVSSSFAKPLAFECTAYGKLRSAKLIKSGPAHVTELDGIVFNVEETGNMLLLAMFDEDGTGARTSVSSAMVTKDAPANLTLTFINGAPKLVCVLKN